MLDLENPKLQCTYNEHDTLAIVINPDDCGQFRDSPKRFHTFYEKIQQSFDCNF